MILTKDKGFYSELFKLSLPIALGSLITFSLSLSGNLMSASLGSAEAGAVFLGNQVQLTMTMLNTGIEGAILVLAARADSRGKNDSARRFSGFGIFLSLIISILFFIPSFTASEFTLSLLTDKKELLSLASPYLRIISISFIPYCLSQSLSAAMRAVKKPKIGFIASFAALALTLPLDYILIFGNFGFPRLGIIGAALASLLGRCAELLFVLVYVFFKDRELRLKIHDIFIPKHKTLKEFFSLGSPIILAQGVWCINNFFSSAILGRLSGEGVVAAAAAATALYNLSYVVTNGMSGAVGIITARAVGEGRKEKMCEYSRTVGVIFILLGALTGLFMQASKEPIIALWHLNGEARDLALDFIGILSVFVIGTSYQSASLGGLIKSSGNTAFILKTEAFSVFALIIPLSLLFASIGAHPCFVFAALKCDQIAKCPIAYLGVKRLQKKWANE